MPATTGIRSSCTAPRRSPTNLWEDLGFRAPDNIITPCGAGSNVLGCEIGFSELLRAGQIECLPRIFAAQPANCAPIAAAFMAGSDEPVPTEITPTMAEGTAIARPIRMREVLGTLRETRGGAVMLTEQEIAKATLDLAGIGIYVEPTSAQAAAAFGKLLETGTITAEQTTVLVMTGHRPEGHAADRRVAGDCVVSKPVARQGRVCVSAPGLSVTAHPSPRGPVDRTAERTPPAGISAA